MPRSSQKAKQPPAQGASVDSDAPIKNSAPKKAVQRGIQSVEIGFTILDAMVRAGRPISLSALAEATGLTTANAHYYLVSFQRVGVVLQDSDTGHYGLGSYALRLGVAALEQFDFYKLAKPAMAEISGKTGHTVFFGVWGNKGPTIVNRVEGGKSKPLLELRVGSVLPLLSSALGRNFAAHLPESMTEEWVEDELLLQKPVASLEDAEVPLTREAFRKMAATIREQGYSRCRNTLLPNFTSVSAPIFDLSGMMVAALTVMGPSHLLSTESEAETIRLLKEHATKISQTAGIYG